MKVITTLKVRFRVGGFHHWPQAPEGRKYLARPHRHMFHFQVERKVEELNREVEFHDLLRDARYTLTGLFSKSADDSLGFQFGDFSCEQIARELLEAMPELSAVEVWEDGECGGRVERVEAQ